MPMPVSYLTTFKVSPSEILIMGGVVKDVRNSTTYKTNEVLLFNVIKGQFSRLQPLEKVALSYYPPFYNDHNGALYLIDEESNGDSPPVIKYDLAAMSLSQ